MDRGRELRALHRRRKRRDMGHGQAGRPPEDHAQRSSVLQAGRDHRQHADRRARLLGPRQPREPPSRGGRTGGGVSGFSWVP